MNASSEYALTAFKIMAPTLTPSLNFLILLQSNRIVPTDGAAGHPQGA
jgi:hypothetical protein